MSKLEQLIEELCPHGVEWKALGEVCEKTTNITWKDNIGELFQYIDLSSVDRETSSIVATEIIDNTNAPSRAQKIVKISDVIFGTTRPLLRRYTFIDQSYDGQICSTGFCVLRAKEKAILPKFIFHLVSQENFYRYIETMQRGSTYPAVSDSDVKAYRAPIPPLVIQEEIVRILDKFTELTTELTTELAKRHQQYQYYRDEVLTFSDDVEWKALGDIAKISSGRNKEKAISGAYPVYGSTGVIGYSQEYQYDGEALLVARVGAYAGLVKHVDGLYDVSDNTLIVKVNDGYSIKFLYYLLVVMNLNQYAQGGGQPLITATQLKRLPIPIPPLAEQERIVAILDRFDALCNDITKGLPAEIEARKKQYEHYRDQLLTFKELSHD